MKLVNLIDKRFLGAILFAILLLGLSLRIIDIGRAPFQSGDDISIVWASTWYYPRSLETFRLGDGSIEPNPIGILTLIHGPLQPVIAMAWVTALDKFGLPISETVWHLPFALLGTLVVALSYWYGREVQSHRAGVLCAALTAVIPLHVMFSRTSGESHFVLATLFQLLSLSAWWRYLRSRDRRFQLIAGLSVGMDMLVDFMFPGLLMVMAVMTFFRHRHPNGIRETIGKSIRQFVHPMIILPVLAGLAYHAATIYLSVVRGSPAGMFGRVFSETKSSTVNVGGLFIESAFSNLQYATNILFMISMTLCLGFFFLRKSVRTVATKTTLVWAFVFFVPFVFLIERDRLIGHFIPVAVAGAIFIALVLDIMLRVESRWMRFTSPIIGAVLFISLAVTTVSGVFGWAAPSGLWHPGDHGAVGGNRGTRTAAHWIRENTGENSVVFSDPFAGQTTSVGMYYYHRPIISMELGPGTTRAAAADLLQKNIDMVDYVVVGIENRAGLLADQADVFSPVVEVLVGGEPTLLIMHKTDGDGGGVIQLQAELIDPLFSSAYDRLDHIVNIPLFEIQQTQERVTHLE